MWQGAGQPEQGEVVLVVMELGVDDNLLDIHLNLFTRVSYSTITIIIITSVPSLLPRSQSPSTTVHRPPPRAETMLLKII